MPKVQPHREIGPNNAGKMIIRGICFPVNYRADEKLATRVDEYMKARGTVSDIVVPKPNPNIDLTTDEIQFIMNLIDKFRAEEIPADMLPKSTREQLITHRNKIVTLAKKELEKFQADQVSKEIKESIGFIADVIIRNVSLRDVVTYEHTMTWPESVTTLSMFEGLSFAEDEVEDNNYIPPVIMTSGSSHDLPQTVSTTKSKALTEEKKATVSIK